MKFIDLSLTIENVPSEPEPAKIDYISHEEGAEILGKDIDLSKSDFPNGMAINLERISLTSHTGTHLDAPFHYGPISENKLAKKIDEIPLSWCYGNGLLIDLSDSESQYPVSKDEIITFLKENNCSIEKNSIVLINTGASKLWGTEEYFTNFRGVSPEATEYIVSHNVKIIGVDSFGFDPPFHKMLKNYSINKSQSSLWPAHIYGREKEYCQIERLTNLENIGRVNNFTVSCFPIKIKDSGAGWSRVVAIIDEENNYE